MSRSRLIIITLLLATIIAPESSWAAAPTNIIGDAYTTNLRTGDFTFDDIPKIITNIIEFLLGVAGSISIVAMIYGAFQMQLNSGILGKSDEKGKKMVTAGIVGFIISLSSWFVITKFVEIFSGK